MMTVWYVPSLAPFAMKRLGEKNPMRAKRPTFRRVPLFLALAVFLPILLSACGASNNHTFLNPAGPIASKVNDLWWLLFWIATAIEVLVAAVVITAIVRFRRQPNDADPVQITGNTRLEIAWTIAPSAILVVLLVLTLSTMISVGEPKQTTMRVTASGHLWWWEFDYQGMNLVTGNEMHIPVGEAIHVDLQSDNVIHAFWVPAVSGKREVIPGHNNTLWLQADQPGTFRGECAEFCGSEHANMNFIVVAQPRPEFDQWVKLQQSPAASVTTGYSAEQLQLAQQGSQTILKQACAGCHMISGLPNYNIGKVGPNLTHIGSRAYLAAGTLDNTPENLARWLRNPQEVKPDNKMPNLQLDEATISQLVAYLESLK